MNENLKDALLFVTIAFMAVLFGCVFCGSICYAVYLTANHEFLYASTSISLGLGFSILICYIATVLLDWIQEL